MRPDRQVPRNQHEKKLHSPSAQAILEHSSLLCSKFKLAPLRDLGFGRPHGPRLVNYVVVVEPPSEATLSPPLPDGFRCAGRFPLGEIARNLLKI